MLYNLWFATLIVFVICIPKWYRDYLVRRIRDHTCWCVSRNIMVRTIDLFSFLIDQSLPLNIPIHYQITQEDYSFCCAMIHKFQEETSSSYFVSSYEAESKAKHDGFDYKVKRIYASLSDSDFFLVSFLQFLYKHECDISYDGYDLLSQKSRTNYGSWGAQHYDAIYSLTTYGIQYQKLLLLLEECCKASPQIMKNKIFYFPPNFDRIRDHIDKCQISISVM